MKIQAFVAATVAAMAGLAFGQADRMMICDSGTDTVGLFDAGNGNLIDGNWIRYSDWPAIVALGSGTPKDAIQVRNQIWVADQIHDAIHRFELRFGGPVYVGSITGGLDNIRGMAFVDERVYVSNAGAGNGAPGEAVVVFNCVGQQINSWVVGGGGPAVTGDPFDLAVAGDGSLIVDDIDDLKIENHKLSGHWFGTLHDSDGVTGVDFPQQIYVDRADDFYVAGFSAPIGIYKYSPAGTPIGFWAVGSGNRGVFQLNNGLIAFTHGSTLTTLDTNNGATANVYAGGSLQYINPLHFCPSDWNGDGFSSGDDFDLYVSIFELGGPCADFNGDGFVTGDDFDAYVVAFDQGC